MLHVEYILISPYHKSTLKNDHESSLNPKNQNHSITPPYHKWAFRIYPQNHQKIAKNACFYSKITHFSSYDTTGQLIFHTIHTSISSSILPGSSHPSFKF
jgi:hypothetical protein